MIRRATILYSIPKAALADEPRHPGVVMRAFCHEHGLRVLEQAEQIGDQTFTFEVEATEKAVDPQFPGFMTARPHR